MPECGSSAASAWDKNERSIHQSAKQNLHPVGFEPTSTNTFELESNSLDRSDKNAFILNLVKHIYSIHFFIILITTHYASHIVCG